MGAMVASGGSSFFQLQGLNAKIKDISNTPPSLSKLGGNSNFDYGNDINGLYVIKKQITPTNRKRLSDFFKMYGYKVNELKVPNLRTREHFNFLKTIGANIIGSIPQDQLRDIQEIFNKGVTVWHTDDIGNYNLTNGDL